MPGSCPSSIVSDCSFTCSFSSSAGGVGVAISGGTLSTIACALALSYSACSSRRRSPSSSSSSFLRNSKVYCAANNSSTASGSNTKMITIMTHFTASSSIFLSAASPYTNSAIYLIGPTSASSLRYSASSCIFSSVNPSISVAAVAIRACCASMSPCTVSAVVVLPSCVRKRFISVLLLAICCSALLRKRVISARAAITVGDCAASCSFCIHSPRSTFLAS